MSMQEQNQIDSIIYEEKPGQYRNIANLLGIDEIDQNSQRSNGKCLMCPNYRLIIQQMQDKFKKLKKKQQKYKHVFNQLENHNCLVMRDTDDAVKNFQAIVRKLQSQTMERDQIIMNLSQEVQHYKGLLSDQSYQYEETITQLTQKISALMIQHTQKTKKFAISHKDQILLKNKQINQLRSHIMNQVTQKAILLKKYKQQSRKWEVQLFQMKQEIKSLQNQKQSKQKLIKCLSDSNNEIRIQLIELKNKIQFQDLTWATDKKRSFLNQYEEDYKLKRQNQQLKSMAESLQSQLQNLMTQTQQMETLLVKTKLQRDMFKKTSQKLRSYSSDSRVGYGSIQKNSLPINSLKLKTHQSARQQSVGRIRANRTGFMSMNQSSVLSQEIIEEDMENSVC